MFKKVMEKALIKKMKEIDRLIKEEWIPNEKMEKNLREFVKSNREYFKTNPKNFTPMILIGGVNEKGEEINAMVGTEFPPTMEKREIFEKLGEFFAKNHEGIRPMYILWVAESWIGTDIKVAPSKDANREEGLITTIFSCDHRVMTAMQKIGKGRVLGRAKFLLDTDNKYQDNLSPYFFKGWVMTAKNLLK